MKGSPAIGTRLLNGLDLKHQSRFGLDCLNDHSIAEDLSRLLVERTSRGVEAFNCTLRGLTKSFLSLCEVLSPGRVCRAVFNCTLRGLTKSFLSLLRGPLARQSLSRGYPKT